MLARALLKIGVIPKTENKKISENTLRKRQAAVRLIALNPSKFEELSKKYRKEFLGDNMFAEIRYELLSYYNDENDDKDVEIPTLKHWLEQSRDGSFWPAKSNWTTAATAAYENMQKSQEKE